MRVAIVREESSGDAIDLCPYDVMAASIHEDAQIGIIEASAKGRFIVYQGDGEGDVEPHNSLASALLSGDVRGDVIIVYEKRGSLADFDMYLFSTLLRGRPGAPARHDSGVCLD